MREGWKRLFLTFGLPLLPLSLLFVDAGSIAPKLGALLWMGIFIYFRSHKRVTAPFVSFIMLLLYILAEIITYDKISAQAFTAYLTSSLAMAFILAGLQQVWRGRFHKSVSVFNAVAVLILTFPAIMCIAYYVIFENVIPPDAFFAIGQTNLHEAFSFFIEQIGLQWVLAFLIICAAFALLFLREKHTEFYAVPINVLVIVLSVCLVNIHINKENLNLITKMKLYAVQYADEMEKFKKQQQQKKNFPDLKATKKETGEVAVLIIGEALNKENMALYHYQRDTTPYLSSFYKQGEILRFDNVYSSHTHTMQNLSLALTESDLINGKKYFESPTIIDVVKSAGFETYWISNQALYGPWDNLVSIIAETADHLISLNRNTGATTKTHNFDGASIGEIERILATKTDKNRLIIVHLMGSHAPYCERYPSDFSLYKNEFQTGEFGDLKKIKGIKGVTNRINCYDNSVRYNDHVVASIIRVMKQHKGPGFVLYFSDHAEETIEGLGHNSSQFVYEMTYIPMIFWASNDYRFRYPAKMGGLKGNVNKLFSNEHIYETLIGLMNIETKNALVANDISSAKYKADQKPTYILYKEKQYALPENRLFWLTRTREVLKSHGQDTRVVAHRINTLGKLADAMRAEFRTLEIDLVFNSETKRFNVGHDKETMVGKTLEDFLDRAPEGGFDKIWLDIKNAGESNLQDIAAELKRLDAKYSIKKSAIAESGTQSPKYSILSDAGFHTSYYLPTGTLKKALEAKDDVVLRDSADKIAAQVKMQRMKAVSFDIALYPFVKKYLEKKLPKDVVYHTWDTKLKMDDENFIKKIQAKDYYGDKRLKTILVSFPSRYHY